MNFSQVVAIIAVSVMTIICVIDRALWIAKKRKAEQDKKIDHK